MNRLTIRRVPDETIAALKAKAEREGTSVAKQVRFLLLLSLVDSGDLKIGSALKALGLEYGGIDLDFRRDQTPAGTVDFGSG